MTSASSRHTQNTNITVYSDRPDLKHWDSSPGGLVRFVEEPLKYQAEENPRTSAETYASTVASVNDLDVISESDVLLQTPECFASDAIPTTSSEFAELFPSTRRFLIHHDDSTSDGNLNLRVDTEIISADGLPTKMILFHMRVRDLKERKFSLRRYCRDSGREICSSKKKYRRPGQPDHKPKRPLLARSLTNAFTGIKTLTSPRRHDSGYSFDLGDVEDELRRFTLGSEAEATIPTNIIRMEFSNYAQIELHPVRKSKQKQYDFEYWGEPYAWKRQFHLEGQESFFSLHLHHLATGKRFAQIMPDELTQEGALIEALQGGWVPPSSLRIIERNISDDLGDVIVATGLTALLDNCLRHRSRCSNSILSDRLAPAEVESSCQKFVGEGFHRPGYTAPRR